MVKFGYSTRSVFASFLSSTMFLFLFICCHILIDPVFEQSYTQYIPLPISELDSWLKTPSIYVFDCSAARMILNAFAEVKETTNLLI